MPYTSREVRERVARRWPVGHCEAQGERWAVHMRTTLERTLSAFACDGVAPDGRKLAAGIRAATSFRVGTVPTLYVTERYLREWDDAAAVARLAPDERGHRFEHVVPLQFTLPAAAFAQDPCGALATPDAPALAAVPWLNRVARSLLTPVCFVSRHEDVRLARRTHPDWLQPFARYADPMVLRHAPGDPIVVYNTLTGEQVGDLASHGWADHLAAMKESPLFSPVAREVEAYFTDFTDREASLFAAMASSPGGARWPDASTAGSRRDWYSEDEQIRIRRFLQNLAASGPRIDGVSAFEIPVNASRVTLTVRHPIVADRLLVRINIGPEHGKRELYFNDRDMHAAGRGWIARIAQAVNMGPAGYRLVPQKTDNARRAGFDIRYDRSDRRPHVDRIETALGGIIPVMQQLHATAL